MYIYVYSLHLIKETWTLREEGGAKVTRWIQRYVYIDIDI